MLKVMTVYVEPSILKSLNNSIDTQEARGILQFRIVQYLYDFLNKLYCFAVHAPG